MKMIFISHSTKDGKIATEFMEEVLINGLGIAREIIFNTSGIGTGVNIGEDISKKTKESLKESKIFITFISKHYNDCNYIQNQLGIAWYEGKIIIPILLDEKRCINNNQIIESLKTIKADNEVDLEEIKDLIVKNLNDEYYQINNDKWIISKTLFINKIKNKKTNFEKSKVLFEVVAYFCRFIKRTLIKTNSEVWY